MSTVQYNPLQSTTLHHTTQSKMYETHIVWSTFISSILSFLGCTMMVLYYLYFPADRAVAHVFCLWLGICGIGLASTTFIIVDEIKTGDILCIIFPMIEDYFILCGSFTTVIIAIRVKKIIFQDMGCLQLSDQHLRYYFAFIWGLPLILVLLPLTTGSYGKNDDDFYCFLKHDRDGKQLENIIAKIWLVMAFYVPILLSMFTIIVIYSQCIRQLNVIQQV